MSVMCQRGNARNVPLDNAHVDVGGPSKRSLSTLLFACKQLRDLRNETRLGFSILPRRKAHGVGESIVRLSHSIVTVTLELVLSTMMIIGVNRRSLRCQVFPTVMPFSTMSRSSAVSQWS